MKQSTEQLDQMLKQMKEWNKTQSDQNKIEINETGMSEALSESRKIHDQKLRDRKILVWIHLVRLVACTGEDSLDRKKRLPRSNISVLYRYMMSSYCRDIMKNIPKDWEVPGEVTPFMRALYSDFEGYYSRYKDFYDNRSPKMKAIRQRSMKEGFLPDGVQEVRDEEW